MDVIVSVRHFELNDEIKKQKKGNLITEDDQKILEEICADACAALARSSLDLFCLLPFCSGSCSVQPKSPYRKS